MRSSSACINSSTAISDHLLLAARYGGHYLYCASILNSRVWPLGTANYVTVDRYGHATRLYRESLQHFLNGFRDEFFVHAVHAYHAKASANRSASLAARGASITP